MGHGRHVNYGRDFQGALFHSTAGHDNYSLVTVTARVIKSNKQSISSIYMAY